MAELKNPTLSKQQASIFADKWKSFTDEQQHMKSLTRNYLLHETTHTCQLNRQQRQIRTNNVMGNASALLGNGTTIINGGKQMDSVNSNPQWQVKMPGQPDQAVDTATLQMWARSGVIRPDTLVVEVKNGMSHNASQIPGVFSSKSYVTTLLLSWFLGILGVDRFYLGHTGLGIGKLLTLGGCGIWALIDFILIAMRKVTDVQGNPLA